jgi:hypothetical protein
MVSPVDRGEVPLLPLHAERRSTVIIQVKRENFFILLYAD